MSIIVHGGMIMTVMETEVECPVCTFKFDIGAKAEKARYPMFKTKCPACKSKLGISMPIMGGTTECFEWDVPKGVPQLRTKSPFTVNGKIPIPKPDEDNEGEEIFSPSS